MPHDPTAPLDPEPAHAPVPVELSPEGPHLLPCPPSATQRLRSGSQRCSDEEPAACATFGNGSVQRVCAGTTAAGRPCRAFVGPGGEFCLAHDPALADLQRQARASGGAAAAKVRTARAHAQALDRHADLAVFTADVLRDLLDGDLDPHAARVLLAGAALQAKLITLRRAEDDEWSLRAAESPDVPESDARPESISRRAARAWARDLDPEREGTGAEARMLRQLMQQSFETGNHSAARLHAEALRRLLRDRPTASDLEDEQGLEDGLSADLRRILNRVGMEMGVDA